MKEVIIAGGSGAIGQKLSKLLSNNGYKVLVLTRKNKTYSKDGIDYIPYPITSIEMAELFEGKYAVINLAGHSVADGRWTVKTKDLIYYSRKDNTAQLAEGINMSKNPPKLFVSASATGYYGNRGDESIDENSSKGSGFLSDVCMVWEDEAKKSKTKNAIVRIGVVLDKSSGALKKMIMPFKFFMGGPIGNGKQYMSWINIDDLCEVFLHILNNELSGVYNATAPNPVDMNTFAKTLGKVMAKPSFFKVPAFILQIMLGEAASVVLDGVKVLPKNLLNTGFKFKYDKLEDSLKNQLR